MHTHTHTHIYIYTIWYIQFLLQLADHYIHALGVVVFSVGSYDLLKQKIPQFPLEVLVCGPLVGACPASPTSLKKETNMNILVVCIYIRP